jgi:hypothetical protein
MRFPLRLSVLVLFLLSLAGCAPEFNWRQTSPQGSGVTLLFPCRPSMNERTVRLAGSPMRMRMHSCRAVGATFSLALADVGDPAQVAVVLAALRFAAQGNLGGAVTARPWTARGATPNQQSALIRVEGHLPDGKRVVEHAAFFVKGLRLYQATVLGDSLDARTLDSFFDSIQVVS